MKCSALARLAAAAFVLLVASTASARSAPRNCWEWQYWNWWGPIADGEYTIEPVEGVQFQVYCKDIAFAPKEYITLKNVGGDYNFSEYAAGRFAYGTTVRTSFTKLRIDPRSLLVDIDDLTFATSTGAINQGSPTGLLITSMPYAVAMDCQSFRWRVGRANIDLTGTPFEVNADFFINGNWLGTALYTTNSTPDGEAIWLDPEGAVTSKVVGEAQTLPVTSKVVNLRGGGRCGGIGPRGYDSDIWGWARAVPSPKPALQLRYRKP